MSAPAFPDVLRLPAGRSRLEAAGRRAFAAESAASDALDIVLDGRRATIALDPPLVPGAVQAWPFAALRAGETMLFAAADHPVVMLRLSALATPVRVRVVRAHEDVIVRAGDTTVADEWSPLVADADGHARIVAYVGSTVPDVDALAGSAIARARRRAAARPRVRRPSDAHDIVAVLEHALRVDLAAGDAIESAPRVVACLALLALNDAPAALDVVRAHENALARDANAATVIAGAWAAWRGEMVPLSQVQAAAAAAADGAASGSEQWSAAAAALRPWLADLIGRGRGGSASDAPDPARAIVAAARDAGAPVAAVELLALMHDELGLMPDAARARIRIAPRLVAGRTEIDQIGVGEAALILHAEVENEQATIEVEQTSGATPLTAILEPRVPGGRLRSALVEDTPAELDAAPADGGLTARVQLIIDRRRRLVLHFERR